MKKTILYIIACIVIAPISLSSLWITGNITGNIMEEILTPYVVTKDNITIQKEVSANANQYQTKAYAKIMTYDGKLYYYFTDYAASSDTLRGIFNCKLCTIVDGKITALCEVDHYFLGCDERFVYYRKTGFRKSYLKAYDTQLKKTITLLEFPSEGLTQENMDPDGTLRFFPDEPDSDTGTGYIVRDGELLGPFENMPTYTEYEIGGKRYSTRGYEGREVYCDDVDISRQFGLAKSRTLVPYRDGLLLINDGYSNLLYYIQGNGTIISLFPEFPCMSSESCVNFHENYVYLSFDRFEKWGAGFLGDVRQRFENDTLTGTYRINMDDYSVEKISDNVYYGMFIFDDSGIYAYTHFGELGSGDIHHLDFDGNLIRKIVD